MPRKKMISEGSYPNENDIKQRVIAAICRLCCYDQDLLDVGSNERSLTYKLPGQFFPI